MEIQNLNIITIIIFLTISIVIWYIFYRYYIDTIKFNNVYKNLSIWKYFFIKYIFLLLSFIILLFSIFWIKYQLNEENNVEKWIDMMFILDVSKSMNVYDINNYSRLDIAKQSIYNYVINNNSNRYWLVIFAWDAISTIPLTDDHSIFLTFLEGVDYRNLLVQWSDFNKALTLWIERFNYEKDRSKAIVFISDGWDLEDKIVYSDINDIVKKWEWISYFIAWIWSEEWWKIITWTDLFGRYTYQEFNWKIVISKLNEKNLENIASATKWKYLKISDIKDLEKLDKYIKNLEKKALKTNIYWNKNSINRVLSIYSFIFFLIFLIIYLFEDKKI